MVITYIKDKDKYVDGAGRQAVVADYGYNFYKCEHNFIDVGKHGHTMISGKKRPAIAFQCSKCFVYMVAETK
jgi:hypothetical protein